MEGKKKHNTFFRTFMASFCAPVNVTKEATIHNDKLLQCTSSQVFYGNLREKTVGQGRFCSFSYRLYVTFSFFYAGYFSLNNRLFCTSRYIASLHFKSLPSALSTHRLRNTVWTQKLLGLLREYNRFIHTAALDVRVQGPLHVRCILM